MEINLSNEMIEKIISVALGRLEKLRDEEQNAKEWIKVRSAFEREENLKNANAFLSENRNADGVIETASGLQYKVMVSAEGPKPSQDSTVTLSYKLNDLNGNTLDQNSNVQFNLTNTVPGFKEAVSNMSVGETIVAYVHPDLGYGAQLLDTIAPNSLLIFEIELISID